LDKKKTIKKKSVIKSQLHQKSSSELHLDKEICNQYSISKHSQYQSTVCPSSQTPHAVENEKKRKEMLMSALMALVKNSVKESFYGKRNKKKLMF